MRASIALLTIGVAGALVAPRGFADEPWDGGRTLPVHRLALNDEDGEGIVPKMPGAMPFSTRRTCGQCHDYAKISAGWHFDASAGKAPSGRPGEPWMLVDTFTGTQLPLSHRGWPGTWKPDAIGMDAWDFTRTFARHMPGGDTGEPADVFDSPNTRWTVSGKLEINCLGCHNGSIAQDHSEWARQVMRENFRWAGTAAAGLGDVGGMATRVKKTWIPNDGPNPDDSEFAVPPYVRYQPPLFDAKNRTVFDIRKPVDKNCLNCHSVSPAHAEKKDANADVHTRAGFQCVDCHRNDIHHMIVRGYDSEARERKDESIAGYSCRGCHLDSPEKGGTKLGAPHPKHGGIPPVHFEKLACTACHSGPAPAATLTDVRTSRANRLGIHGRALWFTEAPFIQEPVFARGADGKIAPNRVMWPAFWARRANGKLTPMRPEELATAAKGILDAGQQVGALLKLLAALGDESGEPVFIAGGKVFHVNTDGGVEAAATPAPANAPMWALEKDGKISPLVPDFDAAAEQLEAAVESRLLELLQALGADDAAKTKPGLARGKKIYQRSEDGSLSVAASNEIYAATTWGRLADGKFEPMAPEFVVRAVVELSGTDFSFTEEQLAMTLAALAATDKSAEFVFVGNGKLFAPGKDGKLAVSDNAAAAPVLWPIGHEVRSAQASLGAKACTECHAADSPFLFGRVVAKGPLKTAAAAMAPMYQFEKLDATFQKLFGLSFTMRPLFKMVLWGCCGLMAAMLGVGTLAGLQRLARYLGKKE